MKYIAIIFFIGMLPSLSTTIIARENIEPGKIKSAIETELKMYPEERLIDLYKSFFQGYWGPGHLIPDSVSAHNYLIREMENAERYDTNMWQSLGPYERYFRLNLKYVKDGVIPEGEYLSAFIQSANNPNKPVLDDWIKEWNRVIEVIEENNIRINNLEEDKKLISDLLADGNYVVHHSDEFREMYNPHYRVIAKEYFEILLKKYIQR